MKFSLNPDTVSALNLNREVAGAVDKVFKAWTTGALLQKWWPPEGASGAKAELDPKPDGAFNVSYKMPSGNEVKQEGTWLSVTKNQMVVLNLGPESLRQNEGGSLVTVEFRKGSKGCALMVTHEGLPDAAAQERCRSEWLRRLNRLDKVTGSSLRQERYPAVTVARWRRSSEQPAPTPTMA